MRLEMSSLSRKPLMISPRSFSSAITRLNSARVTSIRLTRGIRFARRTRRGLCSLDMEPGWSDCCAPLATRHQYSSGVTSVVTERFASVMIQMRSFGEGICTEDSHPPSHGQFIGVSIERGVDPPNRRGRGGVTGVQGAPPLSSMPE